jgi:hypothetical protein
LLHKILARSRHDFVVADPPSYFYEIRFWTVKVSPFRQFIRNKSIAL